MKNSILRKSIVIVLFLTLIFSLSSCQWNERFSVLYSASEGGRIIGEASQIVKYDGSTQPVTATPDAGYRFVKWSDDRTETTRHDYYIKHAISVEAIFEKIANTYTYHYNYATENNTTKDIELQYENFEQASLIVPKREYCIFEGWYLDDNFTIQVADDQGNLVIGREIFDSKSNGLYAKWSAVKKITYKILMVYVTEVKATLVTLDGVSVDVDYKMSPIERKICEETTVQFAKYLNKVFSGLINFEAESYFTAVALGEENIGESVMTCEDGSEFKNYNIMPDNITEITGMVDDYRCVMSTFSFNDYEGLLHRVGGYGGYKYGAVHFEGNVMPTLLNNKPLESILDYTEQEWNGITGGYLHEFAHTIEQGLSVYPYHYTLGAHSNQGIYDGTTELYLLNQAIVDGKKVGIPYPYWTEEVYTVNYIAQKNWYGGEMGWIEGSVLPNGMPQRVAKGYDAFSVTVHTFPGYKFVGWSDGVTSAIRTDTDIQSDLTLIAYFEPTELDEK